MAGRTFLRDASMGIHLIFGVVILGVTAGRALFGSDPNPDGSEEPPTDDRLTLAHYFDMESVGDPRISPDGERIVYVRTWTDIKNDRRYSNLWIVDFKGGRDRPLTTDKINDSSPRWSPSGDRICYVSGDEDGARQLYVLWLDSGQKAKITNLQKSTSGPVWSPDGRTLAFTMLVAGKKTEGVKMPPKPEGADWAAPPIVTDRLIYRFDQRGYLPAGFRHIFTVPAGGGTERQITHGDYDHDSAEWNADGDALVFSATRKPEAEWVTGDTEIYSVAPADRSIETLTDRYGPDSGPRLSPKGDRIAYTGSDEKRLSYTITRLYLMEGDGSNPRVLSGEFDADVRGVSWSADGRKILFTSGNRGRTHLYSATPSGKIEQVTEGEFQMRSFDAGPGGRIAAVISTPDSPGDIYALTLKKPAPRRLTRINEDVLGHREISKLEEIWYKSSFDDRDLQGWILKPPGFDPEQKYPLVLYIHGGPHGMYGVGFNFVFQTLASAGYVVLYTNPRGSTGYGHEFGNIIQHKYPGDDYFDLVSGVDELIDRGYIDEERLYVTGGSGGGVLTCWLIGRTHRFRAAVSQYPVINWYSWVGTADIGYTVGWRWFPAWPWEDPEHYMERSPISLVGNVKTPLLLITGENDWRTPLSDTEQYYRALKIQKKEAVLVQVPDEAHGIGARPSHYVAKNLFVLEWFEKHGGESEEAEED